MKLKDFPKCPVETTLQLLNNKWKVLIIRDLLSGTKRFCELKKALGTITQKILTMNLRTMEEQGLVSRKVYKQLPPKVEYTLTDIGYSLGSVLDSMATWGDAYKQYLQLFEKQQKEH